jgi:hypothetical protein
MPRADTLERVLLDNMLSTSQPKECSMIAEPAKPWFRMWMLAVLLIVSGIAALKYLPKNRVISTAADAVLIAGILALVVDPILKRDLLREASMGIFKHILGFEHLPEVKDKLQQIVTETKLIRKTFDLRCEIEPRDGYFEFTVEYDSEMLNPTHSVVDYTPFMEFDAAHKLEVEWMSFTSSDRKIKWAVKHPQPKQEEPGVDMVKGRKFAIQPEKNGVTYKGAGKYKIQLRNGYSQFYAGLPTLHTRLRVLKIPPAYMVSATPASVEIENDWQYDKLQMIGDHITVRWRERNGEWL